MKGFLKKNWESVELKKGLQLEQAISRSVYASWSLQGEVKGIKENVKDRDN